MRDINLIVLGTSIIWGQGLEDRDKIHTVLFRMLQEHFAGHTFDLTFLAHSGATTGYKMDGSVDDHREPRIHGEVPTFYPTILQQIEEIDEYNIAPEHVDLILLDAGINDVSLLTILNPFAGDKQIETLVEMYCHVHTAMLLERLAEKYPRAKIILIGYYQLLTEESQEKLMQTLVRALDLLPKGFIFDILVDVLGMPLKHRLVGNCKIFDTCSTDAFIKATDEVNSKLGHEQIFFVPSPIEPQHSALSEDSWLFGVNDDLTPQDPMVAVRTEACHNTELGRTTPVVCDIASICHPNPMGAQAYAETIFARLLEEGYQPAE
jgi:hypothetical protein